MAESYDPAKLLYTLRTHFDPYVPRAVWRRAAWAKWDREFGDHVPRYFREVEDAGGAYLDISNRPFPPPR